MIIGMSMGQETCLIIGQFSLNLFIGRKTSKRIEVVRGEINEKTAYIQARSSMALEINVKERQAEGEAKMV